MAAPCGSSSHCSAPLDHGDVGAARPDAVGGVGHGAAPRRPVNPNAVVLSLRCSAAPGGSRFWFMSAIFISY